MTSETIPTRPQPKTSVVMTTYNGGRFLAQQLDTLRRQSTLPLELVVGDDGSVDNTLAVLEHFAATAPFPVDIRINKPGLGFAKNFLTTARRAKGEFVAFCDQDDIWHVDKLGRVEAAMGERDVRLCAHKAWLVDEHGNTLGLFDNGIGATRIVEPLGKRYWPMYYGFTITARRETVASVIQFLSGENGSISTSANSHDCWVTFAATVSGRIFELSDALVGYRQHGANVYGVRPTRERFTTSVELEHNILYMAITMEMLDYINAQVGVSDDATQTHISRAKAIYQEIHRHIEIKNDSQSAQTLTNGLARLFSHAIRGNYRDPYHQRFPARSFIHDFLFVLRRHVKDSRI